MLGCKSILRVAPFPLRAFALRTPPAPLRDKRRRLRRQGLKMATTNTTNTQSNLIPQWALFINGLGGIISIIITAGLIYLQEGTDGDSAITKYILPIITGAISYMVAFALSTQIQLRSINQSVNENRDNDRAEYRKVISLLVSTSEKLCDAIEIKNVRSDTDNKYRMLSKKDDVIHHSGTNALNQFLQQFEVNENTDAIKFNGQQASISSHVKFWDEMVKKQKERRRNGKSDITAYVTHSNSILIWSSGRVSSLVATQNEFIIEGGKIFRIFVHHEQYFPNMLEKYVDVMSSMHKDGIRTCYIPVSAISRSDIKELDFDFIHIAIDNDIYSCSWDCSTNKNYIQSSRIEKIRAFLQR